jgi:hypothetical protein
MLLMNIVPLWGAIGWFSRSNDPNNVRFSNILFCTVLLIRLLPSRTIHLDIRILFPFSHEALSSRELRVFPERFPMVDRTNATEKEDMDQNGPDQRWAIAGALTYIPCVNPTDFVQIRI